MSLEHSALAWGLAKQRKRENFLHRQDQLHLIHGKPVGSILFSHCLPKPSIPHYSTVASQCLHFTRLQQQHWKPKNWIKQFPSSIPKYILHHIKKKEFDVKSLHRIHKVNWMIFCTILTIDQEKYDRVKRKGYFLAPQLPIPNLEQAPKRKYSCQHSC